MAAQVVKWWKAKLLNGYRHISVILPSEADLRAASDTEQLLGREEDRASTATPTIGLSNRPPMTPRTSVLLVSRPSNGGKDESDNTDASHLRCQEVQCDVSLEMNDSEDAADTPKEFSFTLYDLEGHGKISKDDVAGLVRTIYDALGLSVRLSPAKSKTVHVKLVVSAEKEKEKEREKDSSEENHYDPNNIESNSHAAVAEKLANVAAKLNNLPTPSSCCLKKDVNLNVLTEQRGRKCWESPRSSYRRKKDKEQAVDSRQAPCAVVDDYCNCRECRAVVPNPTPEYLVKNVLDHPNLEVNNSNKPTPKPRLANASSPRRSRRKCCAHDHSEQVSKFAPEDFEECHPLLEPLEVLRANLKRNNFNVSHHRNNANSNAEADYWRWRVQVDPVDEYSTHPHSQHPTPRKNGRLWSVEQAEHESHCRTAPLPFCGCQQPPSQLTEGKCGAKLTKGVLKEKQRHWEAKQAEEVTWKEYAEPMTSPWRTRTQNHVHNHGSPLHQLKHKNRERDHARAMAQVAHWLVREHLANANDEAGTEADAEDDESEAEEEDCGPKTAPTPPAGKARRGGVARHEHHHVHYHHHYYHYAQSA